MADLTTNYIGLKLRNPLIAARSGLTGWIILQLTNAPGL